MGFGWIPDVQQTVPFPAEGMFSVHEVVGG